MADNDLDFTDVKALPKVVVHTPEGDHTVSYARHHVIANETFERFEFLKALQKEHLWDQTSFKTNGVALVQTIDGEAATRSAYRDVVAGAAHTGYHSGYNADQTRIFEAFEQKYVALQISGNWGAYGSESAWLAAQAKTIHGYTAFLKTELCIKTSLQ